MFSFKASFGHAISSALLLAAFSAFSNPGAAEPSSATATSKAARGNWELVRSVQSSYGGQLDFVLVPDAKKKDIANYRAAANAVAGGRKTCMIFFWTDRGRIPSSEQMPVLDLQVMTAQYERNPNYKEPILRLACWLYRSEEEAKRADAFFMPGVKMPSTQGKSK